MLTGLCLIASGTIQPSLSFKILFPILVIYVSLNFYWNVTHVVYLCGTGVELVCYGKLKRQLSWNDVCQVCTMKRLPISMKVSAPTSILIVPNGCEKYNNSHKMGCVYLLHHYQYVFRIDDTPKNRQIITEFYGPLDVQH